MKGGKAHGWRKTKEQMQLIDPGAEIGDADWYPTPDWCIEGLLHVAPPPGDLVVLEPAAGDGALVRVLRAAGRDVRALDIRPAVMPELRKLCPSEWGCWLRLSDPSRGYPELLKLCGQLERTAILTNPPFALGPQFVAQALLTPSPWVGMLLRLDVLGSKPWAKVFAIKMPTCIVPLQRRPSFTGDGQTSFNNYAWLIWEAGRITLDIRPIG